jgi:hypothetical protein
MRRGVVKYAVEDDLEGRCGSVGGMEPTSEEEGVWRRRRSGGGGGRDGEEGRKSDGWVGVMLQAQGLG